MRATRVPPRLEEAKHELARRGWLVYDGAYADFVSHASFFDGKIVPIYKAFDAELIIESLTQGSPASRAARSDT